MPAPSPDGRAGDDGHPALEVEPPERLGQVGTAHGPPEVAGRPNAAAVAGRSFLVAPRNVQAHPSATATQRRRSRTVASSRTLPYRARAIVGDVVVAESVAPIRVDVPDAVPELWFPSTTWSTTRSPPPMAPGAPAMAPSPGTSRSTMSGCGSSSSMPPTATTPETSPRSGSPRGVMPPTSSTSSTCDRSRTAATAAWCRATTIGGRWSKAARSWASRSSPRPAMLPDAEWCRRR